MNRSLYHIETSLRTFSKTHNTHLQRLSCMKIKLFETLSATRQLIISVILYTIVLLGLLFTDGFIQTPILFFISFLAPPLICHCIHNLCMEKWEWYKKHDSKAGPIISIAFGIFIFLYSPLLINIFRFFGIEFNDDAAFVPHVLIWSFAYVASGIWGIVKPLVYKILGI